jgi:hypothetical protein
MNTIIDAYGIWISWGVCEPTLVFTFVIVTPFIWI